MISIIVPVYNVENYIRECLESILNQTYGNLQIIVVDDGSTDNSGKISDEYAGKDKRIQVIHTKNHGPGHARNEGLRYARGKYVGFVDGDDRIQPQMYEELLKEMEETGADFVHFGYFDDNSGRIQPHLNFEEGIFELSGRKTDFLKKFVLQETCQDYETMAYSVWSKLFRREMICDAFSRIPDYLRVGEDLAVICLCILSGTKVALRKKAFYHYRVVEDSLSHKGNGADKVAERVITYHILKKIFSEYDCLEEMEKALHVFLTLQIYGGLQEEASYGVKIPFFEIEKIETLFGNRLILYGAGRVGQDYYMQIRKNMQCNLLAWVDRDHNKISFDYAKVIGMEDIDGLDYDMLLIAVEKEILAEEIREELIEKGLPESKIKWIPPAYVYF
ncbi:MAG: glycosyltransferase [Lachnospiraceae bacterium]|nr:glycosyltransferase [Lachnospiraceae bacterium]